MSKFIKLLPVLVCIAFVEIAASAELGSAAAQLKVEKWIKGQPVDIAACTAKSNVVVVEFWATWCAPCRATIPHLTDLQKKYKDKGISFVGISTEDEATVKKFVEKMGDKMDYSVAIDKDGATSSDYMDAFGVSGIPHAFVVDKKGRIVWHGHPMSELDGVLKEVLDGTFDLALSQKRTEAKQKLEKLVKLISRDEEENKEAIEKLVKELEVLDKETGGFMPGKKFSLASLKQMMAFSKIVNEYAKAIMNDEDDSKVDAIAARMKAAAPEDFKPANFEELRLQIFAQKYFKIVTGSTGKDDAAKLAKKMASVNTTNVVLLNQISWTILTEKSIVQRDLDLALKLAKAAVDASGGKDEKILDTHARALFDNGKVKEAIEVQKKAVELAKDDETRKELSKNLKLYQDGGKKPDTGEDGK